MVVLAELCRLSLYYEILTAITKYYVRLEGLSDNDLIFVNSKELDNRTCNIIRYVEEQLNYSFVNVHFSEELSTWTYIKSMTNV